MFGYDAGTGPGRLLGLYATHDHRSADYAAALRFVEASGNLTTGRLNAWAPPKLVLTDGESALVAGVRA